MITLMPFEKSESDGQALREELLPGKPSLGVKAGGITSLQEIIGPKLIENLESLEELLSAESAIEELFASEIEIETIEKVKEKYKTDLATLIERRFSPLFPKFQGGH